MAKHLKIVYSLAMAIVLAGAALTIALAGQPNLAQPSSSHRSVSYSGNLTVGGVMRVQKNTSIYGRMYAHGGEQVWQGLLVRSGGVKADSLDVTGPMQAQSATIAGSLQAGSMTGTSLAITQDARIGGVVSATGKITGNGLDAGAGGVTTTGGFSAGTITTNGTLTAGSATLSGLTVTGNVNFSGANVSGLNLNGSSLQNLSVTNGLTLGTTSGSSQPLIISGSNHTTQVGVNSNGALSVDNLAVNGTMGVSGNLNVGGTGGITTPLLQGAGSGPLTLQGAGVILNNDTTLANGADVIMSHSSTSASASHISASGDGDVAGVATITVPAATAQNNEESVPVTFRKPYSTQPVVVITPLSDPQAPGQTTAPRMWVTIAPTNGSGQYPGFTIHYVTTSSVPTTSAFTLYVNYMVVGS